METMWFLKQIITWFLGKIFYQSVCPYVTLGLIHSHQNMMDEINR